MAASAAQLAESIPQLAAKCDADELIRLLNELRALRSDLSRGHLRPASGGMVMAASAAQLAESIQQLAAKCDADELIRLLNELRALRSDFPTPGIYTTLRRHLVERLYLKVLAE